MRRDVLGNIMKFSKFGKNEKFGWDIDHIKPRSTGGSDFLHNLRPINRIMNQSWGATIRHNEAYGRKDPLRKEL